jgi:hypothetical protein
MLPGYCKILKNLQFVWHFDQKQRFFAPSFGDCP